MLNVGQGFIGGAASFTLIPLVSPATSTDTEKRNSFEQVYTRAHLGCWVFLNRDMGDMFRIPISDIAIARALTRLIPDITPRPPDYVPKYTGSDMNEAGKR